MSAEILEVYTINTAGRRKRTFGPGESIASWFPLKRMLPPSSSAIMPVGKVSMSPEIT